MVLKKLSSYAVPQHIHQQQHKFSENLASKIQETVQRASSSLDDQNPIDKQVLLSQSNYFTGDLNRIIFNLQNFVLQLNDDSSTKKQLLQIISKVVETSYGVQHSFNMDPDALKIQLKANVEQISGESNEVLKVLVQEQVPENKQKLLDALNDLLSAADKIRIRNEIWHKPPQVLQKLLDESVQDVWNALDSTDLNNELILHYLVHYIRHAVQHMQRVVHYLHMYGTHYEENAHDSLNHAGNDLHNVLATLQETFQKTKNVDEMKNTIRLYVHKGCADVGRLVILYNSTGNTGKPVKEPLDVVVTDTLANTFQLARGLQHSGLLI